LENQIKQTNLLIDLKQNHKEEYERLVQEAKQKLVQLKNEEKEL
jgi:hypothetical protein